MTLTNGGSFNDKVNFIWSVADLLRGDFKRSEYAKVILPLVVIRRLDCVLGDTKAAVVQRAAQLEGKVDNPDPARQAVAGREFYNTSPLDFARLTADPANVEANLRAYIGRFSPGAFDVIERFRFDAQITRLAEADLLYQVVARFADIDLHTDQVGNTELQGHPRRCHLRRRPPGQLRPRRLHRADGGLTAARPTQDNRTLIGARSRWKSGRAPRRGSDEQRRPAALAFGHGDAPSQDCP